MSSAVTIAPIDASCMVLPPGAAQRSKTFLPFKSLKHLAGIEAAKSCTHQSPSEKPFISVICPARFNLTDPLGIIIPL